MEFLDELRATYNRIGEGPSKTSGNIHPITINLLTLDHRVAEIDADAEFHSTLRWQTRVLGFEAVLNFNGTTYCFHDARELSWTLSLAALTNRP